MDDRYTRRGLLRTGTGAAAGLATAGALGTASAQSDTYEYLEDANNYDGQIGDATGMDALTVSVGAGTNGLAFSPTAILVEPGTAVTWEWTGNGGAHNVVNEAEKFNSGELVGEAGHTFEHTFEGEGTYEYYCNPHKLSGMKGLVAVGEDNARGDLADFNELVGEVDYSASPAWAGAAAFGTVSLLGVAAYREMFDEG